MLASPSSTTNAGIPGGRSWRSPQVSRSRSQIRCSNRGSGGLEISTTTRWWHRFAKDAGVLLGSAAFCLVSGFAVSGFARAEANGAPDDEMAGLPASAIPELSEKKKPEEAGKSYKVPARVLRANANESAVKAVLEKIEEDPGNMVAYKALLSLRMENGEVREAIDVLGKMIEMDPKRLEYRFMRAKAYDLVGDVKSSREEFWELVLIQPFSARALQGLVIAMQRDGEDESEVIELIREAMKNAVDRKQDLAARNFRMLLAQTFTSQEKLKEALEQYEEVIKEDPTDFRPYLCQGLLYDSLGEKEKAKKFYKEYSRLCPESFPQRRFLEDLLVRGNCGARLKDEEKEGKPPPMQQPEMSMHDMAQASKKKSASKQ